MERFNSRIIVDVAFDVVPKENFKGLSKKRLWKVNSIAFNFIWSGINLKMNNDNQLQERMFP